MLIARGKSTIDNVLPMLLRPAYCIVVMLSALWLGGCTDTITAQAPPSASTLHRDYERTLTEDERKQAITDLRAETKQKDANAQQTKQDGQQN